MRRVFARVTQTTILFAVALLAYPATLSSQSSVPPSPEAVALAEAPLCGSAVTPEEAARYRALLARGEFNNPPRAGTAGPPYCVPIVGHIVRRSNGTGGMSLTQYFQSITDATFLYQSMQIQFYSLAVDYIDDDFFYSGIQTTADIDALRSTNPVTDAINIYFTPTLPGLCGISSFTFSSVQGIVMNNGCTGVPSNPSTMAHEIGHYFNLFHTHETAFGAELVDESNCSTAGDLFCDTPADPILSGVVVYPSCAYVGSATDANGQAYHPDTHQIMSYATALCRDSFSPESQAKVMATLLGPRAGLLSRGCTPTAPATISSTSPPTGFIDQTRDVTVTGMNLGTFTRVSFGAGITVNSTSSASSTQLTANITIDAGTIPGLRNVIVDNALTPDTLFGGFDVRGTPVHYVSPSGSGIYPYASPSDAATSLGAVLAAVSDGDTIKIDTTSAGVATPIIDKAITLSGGWNPGFLARVPGVRTRLTLAGNILLGAPSGTTTLDGFLLENGTGSLDINPSNGNYGGGIRIINTNAVVTNCEIRNCVSNTGATFGGGGGIFVSTSRVAIDNCSVHNNSGTRGGGVYVYKSTGTISNCSFRENNVIAGGASNATGGGVAIDSCTSFAIMNCVFSTNTGAYAGGGIDMTASNVTLDSTAIDGCTASFTGGGIHALHSTLSLHGVSSSSNTSAVLGGALAADTCTTVTSGCTWTGNSASLGGALFLSSGSATLANDLFTANLASISGGAVYASGTAGSLAQSTQSGNGSAVGTTSSSLTFASTSMSAFNNIISGALGRGIACTGTPAALSYNLVNGSSGADYDGCAPGQGSVSLAPLFVNGSGSDYHLAVNSPAIDAGDPNPAYNDADGGRADMGIYGATAGPLDRPARPQALVSAAGTTSVVLSWSRNSEADVAYYAVYCDTTSGFVPSSGNLLATTVDTAYTVAIPVDTTYYVVSAVDTGGYASGYSNVVASSPSPSTPVLGGASLRTALEQNVPNPFNPTTTIAFTLASPAMVHLTIYAVDGRRVRTLVSGPRAANRYRVKWDGTSDSGTPVSSGIYFYRLHAGAFQATRKMLLLK